MYDGGNTKIEERGGIALPAASHLVSCDWKADDDDDNEFCEPQK
jgi:hypothetical protein